MELSSLTLRVLLLFFPGVLCALLVDALTVHRERTPAQFLTHAFALGMGSYLSLALVRDLAAGMSKLLHLREPLDITFFDALVNDGVRIAWGEITLAAGVALILAGAISAMTNHNVIFRFARRLGISRKTGEIDVWGLLFASNLGDTVIVRDHERDLAYRGAVEAFRKVLSARNSCCAKFPYTVTRQRRNSTTRTLVSGHKSKSRNWLHVDSSGIADIARENA